MRRVAITCAAAVFTSCDVRRSITTGRPSGINIGCNLHGQLMAQNKVRLVKSTFPLQAHRRKTVLRPQETLVLSHDAIFRTRVMHRRVFNAICKGQCANEKLHRIRRFTMSLTQIIRCTKTMNAHLRQWKTKRIP
ncbi:unnamed protein product [Ixodes persulcatus]